MNTVPLIPPCLHTGKPAEETELSANIVNYLEGCRLWVSDKTLANFNTSFEAVLKIRGIKGEHSPKRRYFPHTTAKTK